MFAECPALSSQQLFVSITPYCLLVPSPPNLSLWTVSECLGASVIEGRILTGFGVPASITSPRLARGFGCPSVGPWPCHIEVTPYLGFLDVWLATRPTSHTWGRIQSHPFIRSLHTLWVHAYYTGRHYIAQEIQCFYPPGIAYGENQGIEIK